MLDSETQADRIFCQLSDAIIRGDFCPGERLSEHLLVKRFGGSRASVREAIHRLTAKKLVVHIPYSGAKVVSLNDNELRELSEVRQQLEIMACRLAAHRMSKAAIAELYQLLELHEQSVSEDDGLNYFQQAGNLDFHYLLIKGCGNQCLQQILCDDLYHLIRVHRYQSSTEPARPHQALNEHRQIVQAIEARDAELAGILMSRHIKVAKATRGSSEDRESDKGLDSRSENSFMVSGIVGMSNE